MEEPAITAGFLRFLAGEARKADALYILGDLFEAWIGAFCFDHGAVVPAEVIEHFAYLVQRNERIRRLLARYIIVAAGSAVFRAAGSGKISINSPALADPTLITRLADRFGVQCIVVGIDTWYDGETGKYHVNQYTGDESRTRVTQWETLDWVQEVQKRGAGEIVLNMSFTLSLRW